MAESLAVCHLTDDPETAAMVATALADAVASATVEDTPRPEAARDRLDSGDYDCLLLDAGLVADDGDLLGTLARTDSAVPVVLTVPADGTAPPTEALERGATDYVRLADVRADGGVLAARVRNALARARAATGSRHTARSGAGSDDTEPLADRRELETVLGEVGVSVFVTDEDGDLVYVNPAVERITGYAPEEILGSGRELLFPDDAEGEKFPAAIADLVASDDRAVTVVEATLETAEGEDVPVAVTLTPRTDAQGRAHGVVGVVQDVSERKARERELQEYLSIIRAIPDEVCLLDTEGRILRIIPPTGSEETVSGYDPEELVGEDIGKVVSEEGKQAGIDIITELVTTDRERGAFEIEVITKDGELLEREDHIALLKDDDGSIRGTVGVLRDIEERKAYERELERQNERLEQFASIASHDLRNPLNLAQGYMEMVEEECDVEHTEKVADALARMEQLIDDTLTWTRQGATVSERAPVDLGTVAVEAWGAVGTETATLEVTDALTIEGEPGRVRQVIENLLRNAVEHGGEDVAVEIGAIRADGSDGAATGFYVADDGPGIPTEEREDVFEAGYSTAADGTGFGLAIIGEICDAHGWDVAVTESATGGARFEITGVEPSS